MKFFLLGIIQGLTEFLPVSSSGHLYLFKRFFDFDQDILSFFIILHIATLFAIFVFFGKDIITSLKGKLLKDIIIVTIVTGVVALIIKTLAIQLFGNKVFLATAFLVNALLLLTMRKNVSDRQRTDMTKNDSVVIGLLQGLAVFPGISRSGITIIGLLKRGFSRKEAFYLSFLMAIPIIILAFIVECRELVHTNFTFGQISVGFVSAFIFGLASLWLLRKLVVNAKFRKFGFYCLIMAVLSLIL